jgi:hypothetical protein
MAGENLNLGVFSRVPFVRDDFTLTREALAAMAVVQRRTGDIAGLVYADTVTNVPAGGIAATDVQAAINELDTEKATTAALTAGLATKQPLDATLTALAALVTVADSLIYATGADAFALTTFTAFARTLLDDVDAAASRTTLGLGTIATQAANTVAITGGAIDGTTIGASTPSTGKFSSLESTSYVKSASTVVASLPAAATAGAGARYFVTNATATTFMSIVAGGGANKVPVVSDGTNWLIG